MYEKTATPSGEEPFRRKKTTKWNQTISFKINLSILTVLVPSLIILVLIACFATAGTISDLNNRLLDAQTDYAVASVDDFFRGKIAVAGTFEENSTLQNYFEAVSSPQDIRTYDNMDAVLKELSDALGLMQNEKVLQVWAADSDTDTYLLSDGSTVAANLDGNEWYHRLLTTKDIVISDPFLDPATGEIIVSIVNPVFSESGSEIAGLTGLDVYLSSLGQVISSIKVGEHGRITYTATIRAHRAGMFPNSISPRSIKIRFKAIIMAFSTSVIAASGIPPCSETAQPPAGWLSPRSRFLR